MLARPAQQSPLQPLEHDARLARERLVEMSEVMVTALLRARGRQTRSGVDPRELLKP
jgi:hypothetical protein